MCWTVITFELKHSVQTLHLCWDFMPWMFSMCFSRSYIFTILSSQIVQAVAWSFWMIWFEKTLLSVKFMGLWYRLDNKNKYESLLRKIPVHILCWMPDHRLCNICDSAGGIPFCMWLDCMWASSLGLSSTVSSQKDTQNHDCLTCADPC